MRGAIPTFILLVILAVGLGRHYCNSVMFLYRRDVFTSTI